MLRKFVVFCGRLWYVYVLLKFADSFWTVYTNNSDFFNHIMSCCCFSQCIAHLGCSFVRLSIYLPNFCPFIFLPPSISHSFGWFSLSLYQTYGPTLSKIILIIRIKAILLQLEWVQQYISGLPTYCIHQA